MCMKTKVVYAEVPEDLKYRLDRYVFENKKQLREVVIEILDKALPHYEEK